MKSVSSTSRTRRPAAATSRLRSSRSRPALVVVAILFLALPPKLFSDPLPLSTAFWHDPAFLRSFNGSYRINARIEPALTSAERGALVEVQKLMAAGKRKEAAKFLQSNKLTKNSPALRFNLGNILFELDQPENAAAEFQTAVNAYPAFRRAHRNLALALVRLDKPADALPHLLDALRLGDSDPLTWGLLGWCRLQNNNWASALQAYRMARTLDPHTPEWMAGMAECLSNLERNPEALGLLDEAVRQRPDNSSFALLRVHVLLGLGRATDAAAALDFLRRLDRLSPDNLLLLATLHLRANRLPLAADCIDAAFSKKSTPTPDRLAETFRESIDRNAWPLARKLESAILNLQKQSPPAKLPPDFPLLRARLAIESGTNPARGESILRHILESDPLNAPAAFALARHYAATNRPDQAELIFQRTTRNPTLARPAWIEIARLRTSRHLYPEALAAANKALEISPSPDLLKLRNSLSRLAKPTN